MGQKPSTPSTSSESEDESSRGSLVLSNITFGYNPLGDDDQPGPAINELWIKGLYKGDELSRKLSPISPRKWALDGCIEIPVGVDSIQLSVRSQDGVEIDHLHLDCGDMRVDIADQEGEEYRKELLFESKKVLTVQMTVKEGSETGESSSDPASSSDSGVSDLPENTPTLSQGYDLSLIPKIRAMVRHTPRNHPSLHGTLVSLATLLQARFASTGNVLDLKEAISMQTTAVSLLPEGHIALPLSLDLLGVLLVQRFEATGYLPDLDRGIARQKEALGLTPDDSTDASARLSNNLGYSLHVRFRRTGHLPDVEEAIAAQRKAIDLTTDRHPELPGRLTSLGASHLSRFERLGDLDDIHEAISLQRKALSLTPDDDQNLSILLNDLGNSLLAHFNHTGDISMVNEAVAIQQRAVKSTQDGDASLPVRLNDLASSLLERFKATGDLPDLREAITAQKQAIDLTPSVHPSLPSRLNNLGSLLISQFNYTADLSNVEEAIFNHRRAVELTSSGVPELPSYLNNCGNSLLTRFECNGDLEDVQEAILMQQRAVEITPEGHANLPPLLNNLGNSFLAKFDRTGDMLDLEQSIEMRRRSIELTPEGHPSLPSRLNNVGCSLLSRFERSGDLPDVNEAISHQQRVVQLTPDGHPSLSLRLNTLGNSLLARFEHTGDLPDVEEAISLRRRAVDITPEEHASLAGKLINLGNSLLRRFERTNSLSDVEEAISNHRKALEITPEGHADLAPRLTNLGSSLQRRYGLTKDLSDIAEAISFHQKAVELLSTEGDAGLPGMLNNLGDALLQRFRATKDASDVENAVSVRQRAVDLTPQGHASLPDRLLLLGISLYQRSASDFVKEDDLPRAISCFKISATSTNGPARSRLRAAEQWAQKLQSQNPDSPEVLTAFDCMVSLVGLLGGLEKTVQGRFIHLQSIAEPSLSEASAAAFAHGRPDKALEWLEEGRCIVWRQLSTLRTPLDELGAYDRSLADAISSVSKDLEKVSSSRGPWDAEMSLPQKISLHDQTVAHLALATRWDTLLAQARAMPGFENFLLPQSTSSLIRDLPPQGYVVILNVNKGRCDALVLSAGKGSPLHVHLPEFTLDKAYRYCNALKADLNSRHLRMRDRSTLVPSETELTEDDTRGVRPATRGRETLTLPLILRGLWTNLVQPIVSALELEKIELSEGSIPPRMWWCPTGCLSFLPIHAAGMYEAGKESETLGDYGISSYIPTVTSLIKSVKSETKIDSANSGLFLTSQSNPPGAPAIPGTIEEVESIHTKSSEAGIRTLVRQGGEVSVEECLQHMEEFSSVHLACHASQQVDNPLASRFLFHKGSLDLRTIIQRDLKNADLAFLSACQTSTGAETLSEEAVHLAAGMLAAGYHRVVATMWSIGDKEAPQVARDFYGYLLGHRVEGTTGFDGSRSAEALHFSIQRLRSRLDQSERSMFTWVPYVHFGY